MKKYFFLDKITRANKAHVMNRTAQDLGTTMSHLRQNVADSAECTMYFPVGIKVALLNQ